MPLWNPPGRSTGNWLDRLWTAYYRAHDHPAKRRVERALERLFGITDIVAPSVHGVRFSLRVHDYVQQHMLRFGAYEPESLGLMQRLLRPGDVMVDVGSHVGEYALHAAAAVGPSGRVVAIDANPRTYQVLLGNIGLNGFTNVVPVLGAVGSSDSAVAMTLPAEENWGGTRIGRVDTEPVFFVASLRLPAILAQLNIQRITLLKLDVEGVEGVVLRSLDLASSAMRPRTILCEYIPSLAERGGERGESLLEYLRQADYELTDVRGQPLNLAAGILEENIVATDRRVTR